jgi:hypothetical protein
LAPGDTATAEHGAAAEDLDERPESDDVEESHETVTTESETSTRSDATSDPDADPDATVVISPEQMAAANDTSKR